MKQILYIDLETTGLIPFKDRLHGVGVALNDAVPVYYPAAAVPNWVREAVASEGVVKVGSNIRGFDLNFLAHQGWKVTGPSYDTSLLSLVLDDSEQSHGLKQLTERAFGKEQLVQKSELDVVIDRLSLKHVGELCALDLETPGGSYFDLIARYCCEDINNTRAIFEWLRARMNALHSAAQTARTPLTYFKNEIVPTESLLLKMETVGVCVDRPLLDEIRAAAVIDRDNDVAQFRELLAPEIADLEKQLLETELAGCGPKAKENRLANPAKFGCTFNIASGPQVAALIYEKLGCPSSLIKRTKTRAYSTKEEHLKLVQSSAEEGSKLSVALEIYFEVKKGQKLISTYTGTEEKGVISLLQKREDKTWLFPQYKQRTATGRLSVFPLQQLPKSFNNPKAAKVKKFFIPSHPDNCFVYSDLSAIEFRNAAHLSQDKLMMRMIVEGIDPHTTLAAKIFGVEETAVSKKERDVAKVVRYLTLYGGREGRLMQELSVKHRLPYTKAQCKRFIDALFELHPEYKQYLDKLTKEVEATRQITAENGRIRHVPDIQYGRFLDHARKLFYGPKPLYMKLLEHGGERPRQEDLYYRARGRYGHALNSAINFPNQSLAASIMKAAMLKLDAAGLTIRASIHDAVYVECPKTQAREVAALVKYTMETSYVISVPLKSETKILNSFSEDDPFLFHL